MKKKEELVKTLNNTLISIIKNKKELNNLANQLEAQYNIPSEVSFDYLSLKYDFETMSEEMLYWFASVIKKNSVEKHYTNSEIKTYSGKKYKTKKIKFPLKIKMIPIKENEQYIGSISVKELMMFRDAQLINYNENTQRVLTKVTNGESEYYKISLNKKAVTEIEELFEDDTFIPNVITLNMPDDTDFYYNEETSELIIKDLKSFDILDGYHRYIAISNIYNINKKFDYPMILQAVFFPEEKARQFIWQEDQKTKMSKVDSDAYKSSDNGVFVTNGLNNSCELLTGQINNKGGLIDSAVMSQFIDIVYFYQTDGQHRRSVTPKERATVGINLNKKLNILVKYDLDLLEKKWSKELIGVAIYLSNREEITEDNYAEEVLKLVEKMKEIEEKFPSRAMTKRDVTRLEKIYEAEV